MANWDEDSITMAVAAARDCLGTADDRSHVSSLWLASTTLPFAERLNAGVVGEALTLESKIDARDLGGSLRAGLSALQDALRQADGQSVCSLVLAADNRRTRAASSAELDYGDGAAAMLVGRGQVVAELLGSAGETVDFVDHFRATGEDVDYHWEERWVRDEGVGKIVPRVIQAALSNAGIAAEQVDHFIFPSTLAKLDQGLAKTLGIRGEAVVDNLAATVGDTGTAHALLMLAAVLEKAAPGQVIVVSQFASGAQALVLRTTDHIASFRPRVGVAGWLARGIEEHNYTKFLSFKSQLRLERGMRGEQDKKTALTTLYRHKSAILGLVAGRCRETGRVHFPPSRLSHDLAEPLLDSQVPYKLAERRAEILSWSAEYLSYHPAPPNHYGQIDFEGGGRILMEFTDLARGDVDSGTPMEMVFRIKDIDERRGFTRYFWKATPVRAQAETATTDSRSDV
ncbi:3-oxoacyl-[acyl-carrier-protein] synthase III C-terminal domain-containing protein [Pseudomonas aeruginosa]|uniref:3-oxoacyl-[acyl-carrier-protein] synthase III C-terminal domain-containing protein n=1 Tax=Pseudomonas aeruginosa TaxID=287 RepID=UPI0031B70FBD